MSSGSALRTGGLRVRSRRGCMGYDRPKRPPRIRTNPSMAWGSGRTRAQHGAEPTQALRKSNEPKARRKPNEPERIVDIPSQFPGTRAFGRRGGPVAQFWRLPPRSGARPTRCVTHCPPQGPAAAVVRREARLTMPAMPAATRRPSRMRSSSDRGRVPSGRGVAPGAPAAGGARCTPGAGLGAAAVVARVH